MPPPPKDDETLWRVKIANSIRTCEGHWCRYRVFEVDLSEGEWLACWVKRTQDYLKGVLGSSWSDWIDGIQDWLRCCWGSCIRYVIARRLRCENQWLRRGERYILAQTFQVERSKERCWEVYSSVKDAQSRGNCSSPIDDFEFAFIRVWCVGFRVRIQHCEPE